MTKMYVIQNAAGHAVAAAYEVSQAIAFCQANQGCTYRLVPFYKEETTEITLVSRARVL